MNPLLSCISVFNGPISDKQTEPGSVQKKDFQVFVYKYIEDLNFEIRLRGKTSIFDFYPPFKYFYDFVAKFSTVNNVTRRSAQCLVFVRKQTPFKYGTQF